MSAHEHRGRRRDSAQTFIRLAEQMRAEGYPVDEVARAAAAHELAIALFSGLYRPSGDPLLSHLVGTASVLAAARVDGEVVAAALVHAAYANGDFGTLGEGVTPAKRARLRAAVGTRTEVCVHDFVTIRWTPDTIAGLAATVADLDARARDVVALRLANTLDDALDAGYLCGEGKAQALTFRTAVADLAALARGLALDLLARDLEESLEHPVVPGPTPRRSGVFLQPPPSYRRRWPVEAYRYAVAVAERLRAALGLRRRLHRLGRILGGRAGKSTV